MTNMSNSNVEDSTPIPPKSWWQRLLAILIIGALLFGAWKVTNHLLATRPKANRKKPPKLQTLATVKEMAPINARVTITGLGQVLPSRQIDLNARVTGQVIYLHPNLIPGGRIAKDEVLVRLDQEDYLIAVQRQQNSLVQAETDLQIEQGSQNVAKEEWQLINKLTDDIDQSSQDLALRKPQLAKAMLDIEAAETDLAKAKLDLQRTVIRAPFNGVVHSKSIDLGSQVSSQTTIASLIGTDYFWAEISITQEKLAWLQMPGPDREGSKVTLFTNNNHSYEGKIVNLQPDLEQDGLMARLLIAIHDPLALESDGQALLLGSFVRAEIQGKEMQQVFRIPRATLKEGDTVMLAGPEDKLYRQKVSVIWKNTGFAFIDQGLKKGDRLIISNIPAPVDGMGLKVIDKQADQPTTSPEAEK